MRMAVHKLTGLLLWTLLNIFLFFTGVNGNHQLYSRVGDTVILPCNVKKCSSASWNFNSLGSETTKEIVKDGNVKDPNQERSGRLTMRSDCSLHINNLTTADTGQYVCRQYHDAKNYTDASVFLSLLSISSSPLGELKTGSIFTLRCEVHLYLRCTRSICVTWVSETETALQGDRSKVGECSCSSTLTLQHSDHKRTWTCQLTVGGKLKASHSYTTGVSDLKNLKDLKDLKDLKNVWIGSAVAVCLALIIVVIVIIICRKRTGNNTVIIQDKGQIEETVTYAVVNLSAARKMEPDRDTANIHSEYATIKTSH